MYFRLLLTALPALMIAACTKQSQVVDIPFRLTFHQLPVECGNSVDGLSLKDFRLYVHHFQGLDKDDKWVDLPLVDTGLFQNATTALIDFENAQGECDEGNRQTHRKIKLAVSDRQYQAIRFTVGVPFELNHQNPLKAAPPLDESSMHWHWQSGYKFVRAEFGYQGGSRRFHLGSLHCQGKIDHITHCEVPNRPTITLEGFQPGKDGITISLDTLFADNIPAPTETCMGDAQEPWCRQAMQWIGLLNNSQSAFTVSGETQ